MNRKWWWTGLTIAAFSALAMVGVLLLLQNINLRQQEARQSVFRVVDLDETTVDPAIWGKNFPHQYDAYLKTTDNERTKFGGSEAMPTSKIEENPRLVTLFSGYAFSVDYRERRGHAFMLVDQRNTERVKQFDQPGACLNCHASNVVAYRKIGFEKGVPNDGSHDWEALQKGFAEVNHMSYQDATKLVEHPVGCIDCHDPKTMSPRVTRPAFVTGIQNLALSSEPTPHLPSIEKWRKGNRKVAYDPNKDASRQEMRSMVCGQCHVEYHFTKPDKTLTFPWNNGLKVEQIEKQYDDVGWKDYEHKISGAEVLKAQHPEFELWSQGIHARAGVACADCHMPYTRVGAVKISDHQVRSPVLNIAKACQTCHNVSEEEMKARVETIQDRTKKLLDSAEIATVDLINDIAAAKVAGKTDAQLKAARQFQRSAQFRTDFINAENSMGFHAPQESARILAEAADLARKGQIALLKAK